MKRILASILVLAFLCTVAACGGSKSGTPAPGDTKKPAPTAPDTAGAKTAAPAGTDAKATPAEKEKSSEVSVDELEPAAPPSGSSGSGAQP